jgi:hypothetical protein
MIRHHDVVAAPALLLLLCGSRHILADPKP